jgi:hypothetical protein
MLFVIADDHSEDEDTGCWSTLYETFCGIVLVLKSNLVRVGGCLLHILAWRKQLVPPPSHNGG